MTDIGDLLIHLGVALAVVALGAAVSLHWPAAAACAVFWPAREWWQDALKQGEWRSPASWSAQKHLEAWPPGALALAAAAVWHLVR